MINEQTNKNKWIWIGLGAALLFCLCSLGAAGILFYQIGQRVQAGIGADPESAAKAAHKIADYDLPEGYREQMSMNLFVYSFVMISPETLDSTSSAPIIMLAQFQAGADQKQMEEQIRQSFEQQAGNRGQDMHVVEVKRMTLRGEEVDVVIYEGTDQNEFVMRQLITAFPGKDGIAMLMIVGSALSWDQDVIDEFLESIR